MLASFTGTDGDNSISISIGDGSADVVINGSSTTVASPDTIEIDGRGGINALSITQPSGVDVVFRNGVYEVGDFSIALENIDLLDLQDGITISGTDGDDVFVFDLSGIFLVPEFSLNGSRLDLPTFFPTRPEITVDGGAGTDQIITTPRRTNPIVINSDGYDEFLWSNIEEVEFRTPSSSSFPFSNEFEIFGTDGDDVLTSDGYRVTLIPSDGPSLTLGSVDSSNSVEANYRVIAGEGNDVANFLPNDNQSVTTSFDGSPTSSTYRISGTDVAFAVTAEGFDSVAAAGNGLRGPNFPDDNSDSSAAITGSEGDDSAVFTERGDDAGVVFSGESWSIETAEFFETTVAGGGGNDTLQSNFPPGFFLFDNDVFTDEAVTARANSGSGSTRYRFEDFLSFEDTSGGGLDIGSFAPDPNYELDHSVSPAVLRRSDSPVSVTATGFIFHTGGSVSIIAPQSEPVTLSPDIFSTPTASSFIFGPSSVVVQGHNDGSEITIEDIETSGFDTPGRLNFNGEDAVVTTQFGTSLAATDFSSINVNSVGEDLAFLRGAEGGGNTFVADGTTGVLTTPSTTITVTNFDLTAATAGGEGDQATFTGTPDPEQLFVGPSVARLEGADFVLNAAGFDDFTAEGGVGDFANITDSLGDDLIIARPTFTEAEFSDGEFITVTGFETVRSVSSEGNDRAILGGSTGADKFVSTADRFGRLDGDGFSLVAVSFPSVLANGQGGNDSAFLNDSAGDDSFIVSQASSRLTGVGFENSTINFEAVHAIASNGNDTAQFLGTENDESFFANPSAASLMADDFFGFSSGFDLVRAASGGGDDSASLRDSDGNDTFFSEARFASLHGDGFRNETFGFASVRAVSVSGSDEALFIGSINNNDNFVGSSGFSYLQGTGFRNQANGFDEVFARVSGDLDTATLFDSDDDDSFVGRSETARLLGADYLIQLSGFEEVDLFGFNGGENTLINDEPNFELGVFGSWNF